MTQDWQNWRITWNFQNWFWTPYNALLEGKMAWVFLKFPKFKENSKISPFGRYNFKGKNLKNACTIVQGNFQFLANFWLVNAFKIKLNSYTIFDKNELLFFLLFQLWTENRRTRASLLHWSCRMNYFFIPKIDLLLYIKVMHLLSVWKSVR